MSSYHCTGLDMPQGHQDVGNPRIFRQSAIEGTKIISSTHRPPLPSEKIPGTHLYYRLSLPQGHTAVGRVKPIKKCPGVKGDWV